MGNDLSWSYLHQAISVDWNPWLSERNQVPCHESGNKVSIMVPNLFHIKLRYLLSSSQLQGLLFSRKLMATWKLWNHVIQQKADKYQIMVSGISSLFLNFVKTVLKYSFQVTGKSMKQCRSTISSASCQLKNWLLQILNCLLSWNNVCLSCEE